MTDIFEIDALGTHWWIERLDGVWAPNDSAFLAHEIQSFNDAYTRFTDTSLIGQLNCKKKARPPTSRTARHVRFFSKNARSQRRRFQHFSGR